MIVHFAGNAGAPSRELLWQTKCSHRLVSYWIVQNKLDYDVFFNTRANMEKKVSLFLDSGAYSALTQGVTINLSDYIQFIKDNQDVIEIYANLDAIGDAEKTWENHVEMVRNGLNPMPVFHLGEDIKWLKRYLNKGYDYIALGGLVGSSTKVLINWLDPLFSDHLTDADGFPLVKLHGFGLTSLPLILRYPWYSVDSTSWVLTGRMGSVFIPRYKDGAWVYDENSWKIAVSNRSPNVKDAGKHISTLTKKERDIFLHYITEKGYVLGESEFFKVNQSTYELKPMEKWFDKKVLDKAGKVVVGADRTVEKVITPGISNQYQLRDEMNILYFTDLEKNTQQWPWAFKRKEEMNGIF